MDKFSQHQFFSINQNTIGPNRDQCYHLQADGALERYWNECNGFDSIRSPHWVTSVVRLFKYLLRSVYKDNRIISTSKKPIFIPFFDQRPLH